MLFLSDVVLATLKNLEQLKISVYYKFFTVTASVTCAMDTSRDCAAALQSFRKLC